MKKEPIRVRCLYREEGETAEQILLRVFRARLARALGAGPDQMGEYVCTEK